jgi:hypothetical protein
MLDMIIGCAVVFCVTGWIGVHLGFTAGVQLHKIVCRTPPSPATPPPSPEDEWLITHRQTELTIPLGIAASIAVAVDRAAKRVDRPLASNVGTKGTDMNNQRDRSEAVPDPYYQ